MKKKKNRKKSGKKTTKRLALAAALSFLVLIVLWGWASLWFVHHSRKWVDSKCSTLPAIFTVPLKTFGEPLADLTDSIGLTGHDAVYEYDTEAPADQVLFAGAPKRLGYPAPDDIVTIDKGQFIVGWSPSLRHPVWCAYHVPKLAPYWINERPSFQKDKYVDSSPPPASYARSGYDRGHMVPNYAISSRFGKAAQTKTFLTSNIAPQSPSLNRGVWREVEKRIASYWSGRFDDVWIVVGAIDMPGEGDTINGTGIEIPESFYQVIVAQSGMDVYALAVLFGQNAKSGTWPREGIISIDELETLSGLDFLPDLPDFIQDPIEAELPTRLWPVGFFKALSAFCAHYN